MPVKQSRPACSIPREESLNGSTPPTPAFELPRRPQVPREVNVTWPRNWRGRESPHAQVWTAILAYNRDRPTKIYMECSSLFQSVDKAKTCPAPPGRLYNIFLRNRFFDAIPPADNFCNMKAAGLNSWARVSTSLKKPVNPNIHKIFSMEEELEIWPSK